MAADSTESMSPSLLPSGTKISGRYVILRPLGVGGMGAVYLVEDTLLGNEKFALKCLYPEHVHEPDMVKRFFRESQLMRKVHHDNVLRTYDVGQDGQLCYFTMEYVEGQTLEAILAHGPFPRRAISRLIVEICKGLEAIHDAGIIHRDLKPGNIMLTANGRVKIADFGIARPFNSNLTKQNEVFGSLDYMAPELLVGKEPAITVDFYTLGVVLYEIVLGRLPFEHQDPSAVVWMHVKRAPVAPSTADPTVPAWLNRLILNLLAKSAADRPQSAGEIIEYVRQRAESKSGNQRKGDLASSGEMAAIAKDPEPALFDRSSLTAVPQAQNRPAPQTRNFGKVAAGIVLVLILTSVLLAAAYSVFQGFRQVTEAPIAVPDTPNVDPNTAESSPVEPAVDASAGVASPAERTQKK